MHFKNLVRLLVAAIAFAISYSAMAIDLNSSHFAVYEGTAITGERFLYFVPKESTLIIHGDIATPIRFMPNALAYYMRINTDGSLSELTADTDLNEKNLISVCTYFSITCTPSTIKVFSGDFDGDGQSDLAFNRNGLIHILTDTNRGTPAFYATVSSPGGADIVSVGDRNGDGRADLVLSSNVQLLSQGNGQFGIESTPLFANTNLIGAIAGSFRVNEQGAATYNIPIMTFAGTAGVAPQISLNYNSQNGSGIAGVGWSISGLSAISRCRQTESQDGNAAALTFGAGDRFCLDGQRLILTSGSTYGAPESKYRTEIDSGAEVTAKGGTAGNPSYFEVTRKDGSISQYGNGGNSKQLAGSSTLTWSINQFADSAGNPIKFQYNSDNDSGFRINRIDYAFGANKSAATTSTYIAFTYSSRPDPQISYVNAARLANTQRLTKIETFNNGISLRSYNLQYAAALAEHGATNRFVAANKSHLESLYECIGSQCLKPTKFEWLAKAGTSINWNQGQGFTFENQSDRVSSWKPLDFNGDGIMDLAATVADYDEDGHIHDMWIHIYQGNHEGNFSSYLAFAKHWSDSDNSIPMTLEIIDYNADGKQDIAYQIFGESWNVITSKPTTNGWRIEGNPINTGISSRNARFADIDSDGLVDVIDTNQTNNGFAIRRLERNWNEPSTSEVAYGFATAASYTDPNLSDKKTAPNALYSVLGFAGSIPPFDANGDGRLDPLGLLLEVIDPVDTNQDIRHYISYSANYRNKTLSAVSHTNRYIWELSDSQFSLYGLPRVASDINGDGAIDWLIVSGESNGKNQWAYVINGKHWGSTALTLGSLHKDVTPQLVDYNRDGYLDLIWHDIANSSLKVRLWNSASEAFGGETVLRETNGDSNISHLFMDLNGDGALDYLVSSNGKITIYKGTPLGVDAVVTRIDNGMGNQTDISYERLSNRSNHYVGMDKRVAYEEEQQEVCIYDTQCFNYPIRSVNAADYYTALNSDWSYDLADVYSGTGLTPTYIPKDPAAPVMEFTAPVQIVTRVASSAPTGTNLNNKSAISYYYGEAKIQAKGRGLLGFRSIKTLDEQSQVSTVTRYRQDFPFIGSPLMTEVVTSDNKLVKRSLNDYGYTEANSTDNTKRYQVWARNVVETTYDLNGAETSHVVTNTAQPDAWGNITTTTVSTFSAGNRSSFLTQVGTSNSYNGGTNGVRYGRLNSSTVTHKRAGETDIVKSSSFTYYTSGAATNLLEKEIISAGSDGTPAITTTYSYDNFGNKSRAVVSATGETSRQTDWTYSADGRYLVSTTNALNQRTEEVTLRNDYGSPTRIEGLNGYWSEIEYDSQGRETYRVDATGAWQRTTYSISDLSLVPGSRYRITTEVAGGGTSTQYFDVLGRSIARSTVSFEGMTDWTETQYDSSGRVLKQSEPYRNGGLTYWNVNEYDVLGRLKKQTLPDNNFSTVTYNGLETIYINPLGQQRIERRNAAGELIEVQDHLGGRINNYYTATGQLRRTEVTANGKTIGTEMIYNSRGQKTRMFDPDKGTWFYEYTGFGELKNQYKVTSAVEFTDTLANLKTNNSRYQRTFMSYDKLGRMTQRSDYKQSNVLEGTATWTYDTAANGVGKLATESGGGLNKTYYYGAYTGAAGRTDIVALDGGISAQMSTTYDAIGRPWKQVDALHLNSGTENVYNSYGYLDFVKDLETGTTVYNAEESDARGNITRATLLGGETVQRIYDAATGRLQVIKSSTLAGNGDVQNLSYSWDTVGNMKSRNDLKYGQQQSFCYDALNRLLKSHSTLNGSCSLSLAQQDQEYDGFGNITRKNGVGAYTYSTNMKLRPHAVSNAGGTAFNYDNNGNVTSDGTGRTFTYATYDLPTKIVKGTQQVEFSYGADRSRWKRVDNDNGTLTTTWYLGSIEKVQKGSTVKYKRTVAGVAIFNYDGNLTLTERLTTFADALGSVVATRNVATGAINGMAFNPWGERVMAGNYGDIVDGSQLTPYLSVLSVPTTRGFTGHEMVDSMGIVHMNGRIFDQRIGRFLQADIQVDGVLSTQGYNRYAYVHNNPLSATDPSGFGASSGIWTAVKIVVAAVVSYACWGTCMAPAMAWAMGTTSALQAGNQGADAGGIARAAFTSAAMAYFGADLAPVAGSGFGAWAAYGGWMGLGGGITSVLNGGKFGHGFVAAGLGSAAGGLPLGNSANAWAIAGRTVVRSIVGGTLSEITGGKFANGAGWAAFSSLLGEAAKASYRNEKSLDGGEGISGPISEEERKLASDRLKEVLNIAEANGDEITAVYARRALNHGLRFDEKMTATARIHAGGLKGESHEEFGQITVGKSFFFKGVNPELMSNYPDDAALLASQHLRVQQLFSMRHEIAHLSSTNRDMIPYGTREVDPVEIDASRQAIDWIKRYVIK